MEVIVLYLLMQQYQFKAKNTKIKPYPLCLGNISTGFTIDNIKKTALKGTVLFLSVDYNPINTSYILDIPRFLIGET